MNTLLDQAADKAKPRRFTGEIQTGFDQPTTRVYPIGGTDQRSIAVEDRPELEHLGIRFRAFFDGHPNGIDGAATTETGAIEDLWSEVRTWGDIRRGVDE